MQARSRDLREGEKRRCKIANNRTWKPPVLRPARARPLAATWVTMRLKSGNAEDSFWPGTGSPGPNSEPVLQPRAFRRRHLYSRSCPSSLRVLRLTKCVFRKRGSSPRRRNRVPRSGRHRPMLDQLSGRRASEGDAEHAVCRHAVHAMRQMNVRLFLWRPQRTVDPVAGKAIAYGIVAIRADVPLASLRAFVGDEPHRLAAKGKQS